MRSQIGKFLPPLLPKVSFASFLLGLVVIVASILTPVVGAGATSLGSDADQLAAAAVSHGFLPTGSMTVAHTRAVAVALKDGRVLVAGGQGTTADGLAAVDLYEPSTGTWSSAAPMNYSRFGHNAVRLANGEVLVMGGTPLNASCTVPPVGNSAELFNPTTGAWTLTGNMATARNSPTAVLLKNGKVLVAGGGNRCGSVFSTAEIYDPKTGAWTSTGSMVVARQEPASVLLPDGQVLVAGGTGSYPFASLSSAEIYNPARGTWALTGSMHDARIWTNDDYSARGDLVVLPTGQILTAGGTNRLCATGTCGTPTILSSAELYDPATGVWTSTGSMSVARGDLGIAALGPSGLVLVSGGYNQVGSVVSYLASAEVYNPSTGTFSGTGAMSTEREDQTATLLKGGGVLVAGGANATGSLASAEIFR